MPSKRETDQEDRASASADAEMTSWNRSSIHGGSTKLDEPFAHVRRGRRGGRSASDALGSRRRRRRAVDEHPARPDAPLVAPPDATTRSCRRRRRGRRRGVTTDDVLEASCAASAPPSCASATSSRRWASSPRSRSQSALARQKETRKRLGQLLIDDGVVTQLDLTKALAPKFGVSFLDLTDDAASTPPRPRYIDEKLARRYGAAPVRFLDDNTLLVAMVDPQNLLALQDLEIITGFTHPAGDRQRRGHLRRDRQDLPRPRRRRRERRRRRAARGRGRARRHPRRHRRGADRQAGQLRHRPVGRRRRQRHPLRAAGQGAHGPLPHRRRAARDHVDPAAHAVGRAQPPQDHGRPRHRRAARAAGRAHRPDGRRQAHRHARRHAADRVRREDRHAPPRQVQRDARPRGPGLRARRRSSASASRSPSPYGAILVTGPTGSGKSTTLYAALNILNSTGEEHHHGRGPGRVPAHRHQPGAGQHARRA